MTLLSQQPFVSGRDDPVTTLELRAATYRYTSRVTDSAWEPHRVNIQMGPVENFLKASRDRADFEMRCWALEEQTINLGLHPLQRTRGIRDARDVRDSRDSRQRYEDPAASLPSPGKLVKDAAAILGIIT